MTLKTGFTVHYQEVLVIIDLCPQGSRSPDFGAERRSCMVWEINMGVCPRLDFDNIMLFNCLGYNFNIYGAFEFLCNSIANL